MTDLVPGTEVRARGLRWEIAFAHSAGEQQLYRLRCLEGDLRGQEYDLLSPFETIEPIAREPEVTKPGSLADWRTYHQAFLLEQELGPGALLAAQPGRLKPMAYQLVPVVRALQMPRPRLMLADDVGLGKTIEAGLVLAELIARRRAHRILIVAPAGPLLLQWKREMRDRFGLRFEVMDASAIKRIRHENELGANAFDHEALSLISIDFAKQERILQELERTQYDVVVLDEAHHCASLSGAGRGQDSLRRTLAEVLARRSDSLLLLTATPHDGYDPHFASLMELLDPSLVDGRGALRGDRYLRHFVRRLKRHIKNPDTGGPMFLEREIVPVAIDLTRNPDSSYARLQRGILALAAPQLKRAIRNKRYDDALAVIALLKRSVSTARACEATLSAVDERLGALAQRGEEAQEARRQRIRSLKELSERQDRFGALSFEEEQDQSALEAESIATDLVASGPDALDDALTEARAAARHHQRAARDRRTLRTALQELSAIAAEAKAADPKLRRVLDLIATIRRSEPSANVLVYTEYTDSQEALVEALTKAATAGELAGTVLALSGDDPEKKRIDVTDQFKKKGNLVLVSTDATAEGLDLHERCHHLIHLELPYNPNRLEQRNGRIDRFGQRQPPNIHYLYLQGTFEERLLLRLVAKHERQRERLRFAPNTLGLGASEADLRLKLLEGLCGEQGSLFQGEPVDFKHAADQDDVSNAAYKDLLDELDRVFTDFEKTARTHGWLSEVGAGAGTDQQSAAEQARQGGLRAASVELLRFLQSAFSEEPGGAARADAEGTIVMQVPPSWRHGLDGLPGYDDETGEFRFTTDVERTQDTAKRSLGYLGRAHPLVRKALDRVRHVRVSGGSGWLDRRVALARSPWAEPALLVTFLVRVSSEEGREFERVVAVRWRKGHAPEGIPDAARWLEHCSDENAAAMPSAWKTHFGWAKPGDDTLRALALASLAPALDEFQREYEARLDGELRELDAWLAQRASELCGAGERQAQLFESSAPLRTWRLAVTPAERLGDFALDRDVSPARRADAKTALELFERRREAHRRRRKLGPREATMLGLLLLVPKQGGK